MRFNDTYMRHGEFYIRGMQKLKIYKYVETNSAEPKPNNNMILTETMCQQDKEIYAKSLCRI